MAGSILSLAAGVLSLKFGIDLKTGVLSLMKFPGIHPQEFSYVIIGVGIGLLALGANCIAALLFKPFAVHTPAQTWELMSPAMRKVVKEASRKKTTDADLHGDLAFEALQITSMPKEKNLSLRRDALGARLRISLDMIEYVNKQARATHRA